jgi:hypothetical protein
MKTSMDEVYTSNSNTFKWQDVTDADLELIITGYDVKEFEQETDDGRKYMKEKVILSFAGHDKKLICNVTNAGAIAKAYGRQFPDWIGKPIILFEGTWGPDNKPCVRVRIQKKTKPVRQSENPADDMNEAPF